jgi:membrane protein
LVKKIKAIGALFQETFKEWQNDNGTLVAAGLSFFAMFSLAPIIFITVAIVGRVFEETEAKDLVMKQIAEATSPNAAQMIDGFVSSTSQAAGPATIIGSILLLWASSRIFAHLQRALNIIWDAAPPKTHGYQRILVVAFKRLRAIMMTLLLGTILLLVSFVEIGLAASQDFLSRYLPELLVRYGWPLASFTLSLALFTVIFALIYKWLPQAAIGWKDVWVGALFSSVTFALGRFLISLYFRYSDVASPVGVAGSMIAVFIWIYFAMLIFLFGAEFTWVYAHQRRQKKRGRP